VIVELAGHSCDSVHSATEALAYSDFRCPTVVVIDLSMPNLDGMGLARWPWCSCARVPLIPMTAQELDGSELLALRRTFPEVIFKPIEVERFLNMIDRLMLQNGSSRHS
jgi:DNA-binding response OmpR family regulator